MINNVNEEVERIGGQDFSLKNMTVIAVQNRIKWKTLVRKTW